MMGKILRFNRGIAVPRLSNESLNTARDLTRKFDTARSYPSSYRPYKELFDASLVATNVPVSTEVIDGRKYHGLIDFDNSWIYSLRYNGHLLFRSMIIARMPLQEPEDGPGSDIILTIDRSRFFQQRPIRAEWTVYNGKGLLSNETYIFDGDARLRKHTKEDFSH